jgi:hypothetical protein
MEKMEDDLKKKWKTTSKENGRRPQKKMEDDLKKSNGRPINQSTKINLLGSDTIVNSPSL